MIKGLRVDNLIALTKYPSPTISLLL